MACLGWGPARCALLIECKDIAEGARGIGSEECGWGAALADLVGESFMCRAAKESRPVGSYD